MRDRVVEKSILYHVNKERKKRGLVTLEGHPSLIKAARAHSRWMARTGKMSHTGAGGSSPQNRASQAGYPSGVGENLWNIQPHQGKGGTWKSKFRWHSDWTLGKAAVISWMNSPGHRANILHAEYAHIGIGVARSKIGRVYLTQNFGMGAFGIVKGCLPFTILMGCLSVTGITFLTLWVAYM